MLNLLLLFLTPWIASLLLVICIPFFSGKVLHRIATTLSLVPLAFLVSQSSHWNGAAVEYTWIPALSVHFHLSIDALSLIFLYLTSLVIPMSFLAANSIKSAPATFYVLGLILQGLLIGFFTAKDLLLFTLFWESMLLPLYFIIALWGGPQRQTAAAKFLIYMIAGSSLLVAAVLGLFFSGSGSFNLDELARTASSAPHASLIAGVFLLAFAVKTPLFPFHAWLPDAYYQSSTSGTILLSGILSKAGIYGIVRISMGLFPELLQQWSPWLILFAIVGVIYGALAAWGQYDYKRLIAYSSFSHVNFILVGLFVWNATAHTGAVLQAVNHGITITALFMVAGWLESRIGTTAINPSVGGVGKFLPKLCWLTLFFVLASVALPGTNNFVGELLILLGLFGFSPWLAALLGLSVILSVVYMLHWMQSTYFGPLNDPQGNSRWIDIEGKEFLIALPLIILILWIGIYPSPILNTIQAIQEIQT